MLNEDAIREAISGAEEVIDPLDGLVERVGQHPGAAFVPEVLEALGQLKQLDRPTFEDLRAALRHAGVRVGELDGAIAGESDDEHHSRTQSDVLIELASGAELFHTAEKSAYADFLVEGHRETWPVASKGFKWWLIQQYFMETRSAPSSEAMQSALNVVQARAHFDGPEREVCVRVGGADGKLYLDLANAEWEAVEIDRDGWRVVSSPPVRFRRSAGMLPLPTPALGGSIKSLRPFLNVSSDADFVLVVSWGLAVLRNHGPYPVIVLAGEQGSAKSTVSAIFRFLFDPNTAPLRALPREDRDLFIAATNSHLLTFDNVSGLPAWISDTLCRLATGGGFAVRQLYADMDEVLFDATRPVVLNGIEDIVARPDLADRSIFLTLESIPEEKRKPEKELWADLEAARPRILGSFLTAMSHGLRQLPETRLKRLPRMADFALWATACEGAHWSKGTFEAAYTGNRDEAVDNVIESDAVASAIRALVPSRTVRTEWTGNSSDLLGALNKNVDEEARKAKSWPTNPRALSGRVRRSATFLRKVGIDITFSREGRARNRMITIVYEPEPEKSGPRPSAPSAASAGTDNPIEITGLDVLGLRTVAEDADANVGYADGTTVRTNPLSRTIADGADGTDGRSSLPSAGWRERV